MMDYFNIGEVDWYTIDTLEKLCYEKEVAPKSFKLLYNLANRNNILKENAATAFIDLYQVFLAETILSLKERLDILDEIEQEYGLSTVIIGAYERALKSYGFVGHLNSGNTDYKKRQYHPQSNSEELIYYYTTAINNLSIIRLKGEKEFSLLARKSLVNRIHDQIEEGASEIMLEAIQEIINTDGEMAEDIRQKLTQIDSESYRVSEEIRKKIQTLLTEHKPNGIKEEIEAYVIKPPWVTVRKGDEFVDVSKNRAEALAKEYIETGKDWLSEIKILLRGEQRQTFSFAEILGRHSDNKNKILTTIIENYKEIEDGQQNSIFLIGFIKGANDDKFTRSSISLLLKSKKTFIHAIRLIKLIKNLKYQDILETKDLLKENPSFLINLEYLDISNLSDGEIKEFVDWIKDIDHSFALQFLYEVLRYPDGGRWDNLKDKVNELLWVEDILNFRSSINTSLHIEDLIIKSLNDELSDERLRFLVEKIIIEYGDYGMKNDALLHRLTYMLLQDYWDLSWPIIGDYLVSHKNEATYNLYYYIERYKYENELLFEWAEKDYKYPPVALRFMAIYKIENDVLKWDEFAKRLVMKYGNDIDLIDNLSSKFINYSISGSSVEELYTSRKALLIELLDSDKKNLKEFAKKMIDSLDFYIEEATKRTQNFEIDN